MVPVSAALQEEVSTGTRDIAELALTGWAEATSGQVGSSGEVSSKKLSSQCSCSPGRDEASPPKVRVDHGVFLMVQNGPYMSLLLGTHMVLIPALQRPAHHIGRDPKLALR